MQGRAGRGRDSLRAELATETERAEANWQSLERVKGKFKDATAALAKAEAYADFEESRIVALCEVIGAEDLELAADKAKRVLSELTASQERERVLREALKDAEGWVNYLRVNGCDGGAVVASLKKIRAALATPEGTK